MKLFTLFCMSGLSAAFVTCAPGTMADEAQASSTVLSQEICCVPKEPTACREILCTGDTINKGSGDAPETFTEATCCVPWTQTCGEYTLPTVVGQPAASFPCAGDDVQRQYWADDDPSPSQETCCKDLEKSCYRVSSVWNSDYVWDGEHNLVEYIQPRFDCPAGTVFNTSLPGNVDGVNDGVNASACCMPAPTDDGPTCLSRNIKCPAGQGIWPNATTGTFDRSDDPAVCCHERPATCQYSKPEDGMFGMAFQCPDGLVFDQEKRAATDPDAAACCKPATCENVMTPMMSNCKFVHDGGFCLMGGMIGVPMFLPDTSKADLIPDGGGGSGLGVIFQCCMVPEAADVEVASMVLAFLKALSGAERRVLENVICRIFSVQHGLLLSQLLCEATELNTRRRLLAESSYEVKVKATATAATAVAGSPLTDDDILAWKTAVLNDAVDTLKLAEGAVSIGSPTDATGSPTDATGSPTDAAGSTTDATAAPTDATAEFSGVSSLSGSAFVFTILAILSFV